MDLVMRYMHGWSLKLAEMSTTLVTEVADVVHGSLNLAEMSKLVTIMTWHNDWAVDHIL